MDRTEHDVTIAEHLQMIVQLLAANTQLLADIREVLSAGPAAESDDCEHPEDQRVNLSTPADPNHWVCHACRFDNKASAAPPMN